MGVALGIHLDHGLADRERRLNDLVALDGLKLIQRILGDGVQLILV